MGRLARRPPANALQGRRFGLCRWHFIRTSTFGICGTFVCYIDSKALFVNEYTQNKNNAEGMQAYSASSMIGFPRAPALPKGKAFFFYAVYAPILRRIMSCLKLNVCFGTCIRRGGVARDVILRARARMKCKARHAPVALSA